MPLRSFDTSMWGDPKLVGLSPLAKLAFMRLVTGEEVGPHGGLKLRARRLAADLSGDADEAEVTASEASAALEELIAAGMVRRYDDWLWLPQFLRYQMRAHGFGRAALKRANELPDSMRKAVRRKVAEVAELHGWEGWEDEPAGQTPDTEGRSKQARRGSKGGSKGSDALPDPDPDDLPDTEVRYEQDELGSKGGSKGGSVRAIAGARARAEDTEGRSEQDEKGSIPARVSGSGETYGSHLETDTETAREPSESAERGRELLERLRDQTNGSAF